MKRIYNNQFSSSDSELEVDSSSDSLEYANSLVSGGFLKPDSSKATGSSTFFC